MTPQPQSDIDTPRPSVADMQRLAAAELSLPSRVGHVALLVTSLIVATGIGSLWATEPALPLRTRVAFSAITAAAILWSIFALWVLRRRRVLFGRDRVIAAAMALIFSSAGAVGLAAIGAPMYYGAAMTAALAAGSAVLLVRARRHAADLATRRRDAEARMRVRPLT